MELITLSQNEFKELKEEFKKLKDKVHSSNLESHFKNQWLTSTEVCKVLNISKRTFFLYKSKGELPYSQIGRKIYVKISDVEALLEKHHSSKV